MKNQERESITALKYQLKQWRRLVKYLSPTDCDRDDVAEIEKLINQPPNAQMQIDKEPCRSEHPGLAIEGNRFCKNCGSALYD